ncbi:hypothetical protein [Pseudomonas vancouverensis]|uniref:hypothetical protein n=1 Tax=Pseudomonas vancouverensis TaxID=95300 RepID=UPI00087D2EEF|nr:hypothetical protein [Pseudomonas vancouverensis]SDV04179.1 hypothetical protein SAMN05216558_2178 [Pseudomonas vancouverensis]
MHLPFRCTGYTLRVSGGLTKLKKLQNVVSAMNCLICVRAAERIECDGPWEERDCPECGRYRVADALILTLMEQGQIFDVSKTRSWLDSRRKNGNVPSIEIHQALLLP